MQGSGGEARKLASSQVQLGAPIRRLAECWLALRQRMLSAWLVVRTEVKYLVHGEVFGIEFAVACGARLMYVSVTLRHPAELAALFCCLIGQGSGGWPAALFTRRGCYENNDKKISAAAMVGGFGGGGYG